MSAARLLVACAVEGDEYLAHTATMLHSVLARNQDATMHVHLLHGPDITERQEEQLAEMVVRHAGEISYLRVADDEVAGLPTKGFTGKATWYRIFLPGLLPEVDRLVYLDSDVLVLESLLPLARTDLRGNLVGAVTNVYRHDHLHRLATLGLDRPDRYFNAGVLLMDLDAMRREGSTDALLSYGRQNSGAIEWRDQDTLNVVLANRRLPLHPRWNVMNSFEWPHAAELFGAEAVREARRHPAIRHFEGPADNKPWHFMCEREGRERYREHRRRTPWPRYRREGVTVRNVLRQGRRRLRRLGRHR
jgi:lipopolysaccharide biosynthesis glycosyltransferase